MKKEGEINLKNLKISKKAIHLSLLFGTLCAIFASFAHFNVACDDLRTNVLRLHIIANSNSQEDQAIKLKIRDALLGESENIFCCAENIEQAITTAQNQTEKIEKLANGVLKENNFKYSACVKVDDSFFETRDYDNFTLPAGTYKSLIINLGDAKGKNWWCVIFPEVCLPAATDTSLNDTTTDESANIAYNPKRYKMKFWTVELYEDLKNLIKK